MDTEDRNHFKTIASQRLGPQDGSPKPQAAAITHSGLDQAYCLSRAQLLFACYRKDDAHDPEIYAAAVAAVLGDYSKTVIDRATDPRTGIASESKWLPAVAEIREFCDRERVRVERLAKPVFSRNSPPLPSPEKAPGTSYQEMVEKHGRPIGPFEKLGDKWNGGRS